MSEQIEHTCPCCVVKTGEIKRGCWYCEGKGFVPEILTPGIWEDGKGQQWHVLAVGDLGYPGMIGPHAIGVPMGRHFMPVCWRADGVYHSPSGRSAYDLMRKIASDPYDDIRAERARQDDLWGGPEHDDQHAIIDWRDFIQEHAAKAARVYVELPIPDDAVASRRELIQVAALAVAAIESLDRRETATPAPQEAK